ncbi:MAG: energy transducer TonB [Cetobacterium sp.]|uniref:energy transducer TonB n=1 Tax=Cetobacterium sp. TaxID=2071632 RepID=UPI003F3B2AD3
MKIRKVDTLSLGLSILINIIIILCIPNFKIEEVIDKKLKVGLVALSGNQKKLTKKEFKESTHTLSKSNPPKEKPQEKKIEPNKKNENKDKKVEKKILSLDKLEQSISSSKINILSKDITTSSPNIVRKNVESDILGKKIEERLPRERNLEAPIDPAIDTSLPVTEDRKFEIKDSTETLENVKEDKVPVDFGKVYDVTGMNDGLPSGYKLGVEDGDIIAKWDPENKEPTYPESAQKRGMQGVVKLRLTIDPKGNVDALTLEKGSGVPEINFAIEEIARTWKIYLSKNGLNIKGDVILEYNFKLVGKN